MLQTLRKNPRLKKLFTRITVAVLTATLVLVQAPLTQAAQLTSLRAIFKRIKASTAADGITMYFATPTGIQTGGADTITLTFSADFTLAAEAAANFDIGMGDSGTCTSATYTDEVVALTPSATDWGVDVTGQVITLSPETDEVLTAGFCVKVEMGTDATTGGTGSTSTVTNGATDDDDTIAVAGAFGDTGTLSVDIIADDQVAITATVNSTITFTIDDNAIGFGTLSTATGRWATADATGGNAAASTPTVANVLTIATNAQSGYAVTYNGATLTSGGNTISAATIAADSDGTPGTEQFCLGLSTDGDATITSSYLRTANGTSACNFAASTTTTLVSETVPTATETLSVSYLANISGTTEAGAYSTTLTYVATATY